MPQLASIPTSAYSHYNRRPYPRQLRPPRRSSVRAGGAVKSNTLNYRYSAAARPPPRPRVLRCGRDKPILETAAQCFVVTLDLAESPLCAGARGRDLGKVSMLLRAGALNQSGSDNNTARPRPLGNAPGKKQLRRAGSVLAGHLPLARRCAANVSPSTLCCRQKRRAVRRPANERRDRRDRWPPVRVCWRLSRRLLIGFGINVASERCTADAERGFILKARTIYKRTPPVRPAHAPTL